MAFPLSLVEEGQRLVGIPCQLTGNPHHRLPVYYTITRCVLVSD
ncbi:MAG: hypothetical protein PVH61_34565 [Candidatus Aminicenantes bacterium]|jgi:hypothetical protein